MQVVAFQKKNSELFNNCCYLQIMCREYFFFQSSKLSEREVLTSGLKVGQSLRIIGR